MSDESQDIAVRRPQCLDNEASRQRAGRCAWSLMEYISGSLNTEGPAEVKWTLNRVFPLRWILPKGCACSIALCIERDNLISNNINLYMVNTKYIRNLMKAEKRASKNNRCNTILSNSPQFNKQGRPYVGIFTGFHE